MQVCFKFWEQFSLLKREIIKEIMGPMMLFIHCLNWKCEQYNKERRALYEGRMLLFVLLCSCRMGNLTWTRLCPSGSEGKSGSTSAKVGFFTSAGESWTCAGHEGMSWKGSGFVWEKSTPSQPQDIQISKAPWRMPAVLESSSWIHGQINYHKILL